MPPVDTIAETVDTAVESVETTDSKDTKEEPKSSKEETKEEPKEDEDDSKDDKDDEESSQALNLFRALKNPSTAGIIIKALAEQAGVELGTKAERKEVKSTIQDIFKETLGEEYEFLAVKMGPAIEKILLAQQEQFDAKINELHARNIQSESDKAVDWLYEKYPDAKVHEQKILQLMDEIGKTDKISHKEYLKRLYNLAKVEDLDVKEKVQKVERINKNASDAGRLASSGATNDKRPNTVMDIDQAISLAVKALEKG